MTVSRVHLLPLNTTRFERATSESLDRMPELGPGIVSLRGFKFDPVNAVIPHLIAEYGLAEISDFLMDPRQALFEGILWQRLRGTPASMHRALAWVGSDGVLEENPPTRFKWWWFQVHLPEERRSSAFVSPMIAVARASKPLRSEFARVTAGYDVRAFQLNGSRLNAALLNSWSGTRRAPGEPVLSLRVHHADGVDYGPLGIGGERKFIRHATIVDGGAATEQRSSMPAGLATNMADASDPDVVPFSNAPFAATEPFGAPSPTVQSGY